MSAYEAFEEHFARINDLCCIINLLTWDSETLMPGGGAETRGRQISTVARIAQEQFTGSRTRKLIEAAESEIKNEAGDPYRFRAVKQARKIYEIAGRIPPDTVSEINGLKTIARKAWARAKAENDFSAFAPYLKRMIELNQIIADAVGYEEHPYDALLFRFEPGMTLTRLNALFRELKRGITPILKSALRVPEPRMDFLLKREYPEEVQRTFALEISQKFGYDLNRGRLDRAVHPFEISLTRQDVRITARYNRHYLPAALFGIFHETGHALYEQGVDPVITRSVLTTDLLDLYAVGGVSYGMHEAQSRLWENLVGRSRIFWQNHFPRLKAYFPEQLADVDAEMFYRSVNRVTPNLIRIEADEVTYNFHIMLRVEIEAALLDGSINVGDLPEVWGEKMREYLGITPPDDTRGVLQDVHWSAGLFGSFCTYALGNVMSAQLFAAAHQQVNDLGEALRLGDYAPLLGWLTENIYRHGRAYSPDELLKRSTGGPLSVEPYLTYLNAKYEALFREMSQ